MDCTLISELQESKVCPTMNICKKKNNNNRKGFRKQCSGNLRVKIEDFVECLKTHWIRNTMKVFCTIADSDL